MHLLYLTLDCPLPANNGMRMRTWSLLRALRAEGHAITLAGMQAPGAPPAPGEVHELCQAAWLITHRSGSLSQGRDWGRRLRAVVSHQPYAARRYRSPEMQALVRQLWNTQPLDGVVCDTVFAAVNAPPDVGPLIINHPDVEYYVLDRYRRIETHPLKRRAAGWESRKVRTWEKRVCQRAALGLVCSGVDRELLQRLHPQGRFAVVPNIVPSGILSEDAPEPAEEPQLVLFQGGMDWFPNRDAVDYFITRIMPTLRRQCPGVRFLVAGRNPAAGFVRQFSQLSDVEFTGTVPDMRPYLARAAVAVAPLRMGSGTRLKILEAAAMGKPVVSTTLGAEGLDFRPESEILLADDPAAFAAAVAQLLQSPPLRRTLGRAARQRVRAEYSFSALCLALRQALAQLHRQPANWPAESEAYPTALGA